MRTLEDIDQEYRNVCAQIGHLTVQLQTIPEKLKELQEHVQLLKSQADQINYDKLPKVEPKPE